MAFDTWMGPLYLSGLAGELGIGVGWVTLLTSLPWIGSMGQLGGAWFFHRSARYKRYVVTGAGIARSLWTLPLSLALYWGFRSHAGHGAFPTYIWFTVLACSASASSLLGSSSGVAWMSWMKALIPGNFQGRFFGARQRYTMAAIIMANGLATVLVDWSPGGYHAGYAVICVLAILAGACSTLLLSKVPDAETRTLSRAEAGFVLPGVSPLASSGTRRFCDIYLEPLRDSKFRKVVALGAAFNGSVMMAGPYFPYWFTKELHIPMSSVAYWSILTSIGCFISAALWGQKIDRAGDPRKTLWITGHLIAFAPLPYLVMSTAAIRWIAPFEYFTNGLYWSGYTLSITTLMLWATPKKNNSAYFAVYSAINGLAGALGTLLGGQIAQLLSAHGGFRALFAIAAVTRLSMLWFVGRPFLMKHQDSVNDLVEMPREKALA